MSTPLSELAEIRDKYVKSIEDPADNESDSDESNDGDDGAATQDQGNRTSNVGPRIQSADINERRAT